MAQSVAENRPEDVVVDGNVQRSIVVRQLRHGLEAQPVFVTASGGLMTLPGGVLLVLDADLDDGEVEDFFARNGIAKDEASPQGFAANSFLVETAPGFPALMLANRLAEQQGVALSSPNWWRQTTLK